MDGKKIPDFTDYLNQKLGKNKLYRDLKWKIDISQIFERETAQKKKKNMFKYAKRYLEGQLLQIKNLNFCSIAIINFLLSIYFLLEEEY